MYNIDLIYNRIKFETQGDLFIYFKQTGIKNEEVKKYFYELYPFKSDADKMFKKYKMFLKRY